MADLSILAGATSQSILVDLYILSTGAGQTGLVFNSTGLTAYYSFAGATATSTAITLATLATVTTAWSSGGFIKLDDTNMPGLYRFDVPNAVIAAAKGREVAITFNGFSGMATRHIKLELTGWDNQSATNGGLSALPTATAGASTGLLISGTNAGTTTLGALTCTGSFTVSDGLLISRSTSNTSAITATGNGTGSGATFTSGSGATGDGLIVTAASTNGNGITAVHAGTGKDFNATTTPLTLAKTTNITGFNDIAATTIVSGGAITTSGGAVSTVTTVTNQLTAAAVATGIWQDTTAGDFTVASSIGKSLYTSGNAPGAASGLFIAGTNAATTVTTALTTTFTGNLTGSVASVTGAVGSVTGAVGSVTGNVGGNVTGSVGSVTAAVGVTSNRKKGSTATFEFLMQSSTTGAPLAGLTVTSTISKDGAASASTTNSVTGIGNGQYQIVLTGTEMTANNIFLQFTATGAITLSQAVQTQP